MVVSVFNFQILFALTACQRNDYSLFYKVVVCIYSGVTLSDNTRSRVFNIK